MNFVVCWDHKPTGIRISDLAKIIGTNLSYMTNSVNSLENLKILKRVSNVSDIRSVFINVTANFLPKCRQIELALREALRQKVYKDVSYDDFRTYMYVLYKLSLN